MNLLEEFLTEIADAIRKRKGKTDLIEAQQFAEEIESIPQTTTSKLQEKSVNITSTSAISVTPDSGYDAMSKVTITPKTQTKSIDITSASSTTITPDSGNIGLSSITITPKLQSKTSSITSNGTITVSPDTGYAGLSSVAITTNIKTELVNNTNVRFNYNLGASKTQTWTVPASATQAIITYILCCDYQGGSATDGTPTCSASGGTLTKLNSSYVDNNERHRPYTWKLTKSAGKTATVTLRASYYNGANYGHRFGFCQIVWN